MVLNRNRDKVPKLVSLNMKHLCWRRAVCSAVLLVRFRDSSVLIFARARALSDQRGLESEM